MYVTEFAQAEELKLEVEPMNYDLMMKIFLGDGRRHPRYFEAEDFYLAEKRAGRIAGC